MLHKWEHTLSDCQSTTVALTPHESLQSLESVDPEYTLTLPGTFGRWTGDWDELSKPQHNILRLLVLYDRSGFFYDKGRPRGMIADTAQELELYLNKKLRRRGPKKFTVACIPVSPDLLEKYLNEGYGDVIGGPIIVTPERERAFDFTIPIKMDAKLVVITGKNAPRLPVSTT